MAAIEVRSRYCIEVSKEEFRLLLHGLTRRLKGKDANDAKELGLRLLEARAHHLGDLCNAAVGALTKAQAEFTAGGGEESTGEEGGE